MVLADTPPKEAFAAITAGCPIVFACCPVPTNGAQGADAVCEQAGVCWLVCDGLCGQTTETIRPLCDGNQSQLRQVAFFKQSTD